MHNKRNISLGVAGLMISAAVVATADERVPAHPKNLKYPALNFKLPPASQFREVLSNGMVVYIAEDRILPTFES